MKTDVTISGLMITSSDGIATMAKETTSCMSRVYGKTPRPSSRGAAPREDRAKGRRRRTPSQPAGPVIGAPVPAEAGAPETRPRG